MVKYTKHFIKYIFLTITIFLAGCANQLAPGGGEVDRIPPEITEVYPADGTTNFTDDYIEIGFSEYVDKRSVHDAIFISPALNGQTDLDWSGKYVRINFPEVLRENTTYVVTVGTDVVDLNNKNRMANALTLTFSTGEKIDKRVVTGKVYEEKPEGALVFAYMLNGTAQDDTLLRTKPDYISQTGKDGSYKLAGLAATQYRIFAVKDEYRDMLFQSEQDKIGIPYTDITLAETDTLFSGLDFFLASADTLPPRLLTGAMTDRNHILVTVSEGLDSTYLKSNNFYMIDSSAATRKNIRYTYKGNKPMEFVLVTTDSIPAENLVYLFSDSLADKNGNVFRSDFTSIAITDRQDTTLPGLLKSIPADNTNKVDFQNASIQFFFNDAFDTTLARQGITLADTSGKQLANSIRFWDDASFTLYPVKLDARKDYIVKIDFAKFTDAAGNRLDSLYQFNFKTITGLDFTGVSGNLSGIGQGRNPMIILQSVDADKTMYRQKPGPAGVFNFQRVEPGKYILWAFADEDSSGGYSPGWPEPFKKSEEFSYYPDTLNLRARWSQSDIKFNFKR